MTTRAKNFLKIIKKTKNNEHAKVHTEHAGVGLGIKNWLTPLINKVKPFSSRLISLSLHSTPAYTFISAYAPQAATDAGHKYKFYEELISIAKHAKPIIIGGDFNVRLDRKPKGFGDFFLKMPPDYKHTEETLLNQDLFTSFLQATDYSVANTRFQKQPQDLATFTDPISKQDIQMDFILVSNKWKNSIREIHTVSKHKLDTDHNPLIGRINTKFSSSAKHFRESEKPPYLLAPSAEHLQKALLEFKQLQEDSQSVSYETWMQNWIKAARNNFPLKPKDVFKSWISPETTQLMDQRTLAAARGDKETWAWLNRAVKTRQIRQTSIFSGPHRTRS